MRYLKKIRCGEVSEAEEMLHSLFPEALGDDVTARAKTEVNNRHINKDAPCIAGIEFHFGCQYGRAKRRAHGPTSDPCKYCVKNYCIVVKVPSDRETRIN